MTIERSLYGKPIGDATDDELIGDEEPRCQQCHKLLAIFVTRPWAIRCVRCKFENKKP